MNPVLEYLKLKHPRPTFDEYDHPETYQKKKERKVMKLMKIPSKKQLIRLQNKLKTDGPLGGTMVSPGRQFSCGEKSTGSVPYGSSWKPVTIRSRNCSRPGSR